MLKKTEFEKKQDGQIKANQEQPLVLVSLKTLISNAFALSFFYNLAAAIITIILSPYLNQVFEPVVVYFTCALFSFGALIYPIGAIVASSEKSCGVKFVWRLGFIHLLLIFGWAMISLWKVDPKSFCDSLTELVSQFFSNSGKKLADRGTIRSIHDKCDANFDRIYRFVLTVVFVTYLSFSSFVIRGIEML